MERSRAHREEVSQWPCVACLLEAYPAIPMRGRHTESVSQAAHITVGHKRGMGQKSSDEWVVPLCGADKLNHHARFDAGQYEFALGLLEMFAKRHATMSEDPKIRAVAGDMGATK